MPKKAVWIPIKRRRKFDQEAFFCAAYQQV